MEQPIYTAKDYATLLGITKSTLLKMESQGKLPQPRIVDGVRTYYPHDIPVYLKKLGRPPLVSSKRRQIFLNFKEERARPVFRPSTRSVWHTSG